MDARTEDQRAWALAPHLVVMTVGDDAVSWLNPGTGTTCQLDAEGDYVVLRRVADRVAPVVAGTIPLADAASLVGDPDAVGARRAAAHAIVAVDEGSHR
jgi:hypothetical protein